VKRVIVLVVAVLLIAGVFAANQVVIKTNDPVSLLTEISAQPALLYFWVGKLYFHMQKYNQSLLMFEKAAQINPRFAPALYNKGVVLYTQGDYSGAEHAFTEAVDTDPSYDRAFYSIGLLYFELLEYDKAIFYFGSSVQLQDTNANYHFDLAQSYVARFRSDGTGGDYADLEAALTHQSVPRVLRS